MKLGEPTHAAALSEVAAVLTEFGALLCAPAVETDDDGYVNLTVRIKPMDQPTVGGALDVMEAYQRLRYVADVAEMRGLCARYDIPPGKLEAFLRGAPPKEQ